MVIRSGCLQEEVDWQLKEAWGRYVVHSVIQSLRIEYLCRRIATDHIQAHPYRLRHFHSVHNKNDMIYGRRTNSRRVTMQL